MRIVEGELRMLGAYKIWKNGEVRQYSSIEIGDQVLCGLNTSTALSGFLERGLNMDGNTKLFISGKGILAVELPDGRRYYIRAGLKLFQGIFVMLCGIPLVPAFGLGLILLWNGFWMVMEWKAAIEVFKPDAIAVN